MVILMTTETFFVFITALIPSYDNMIIAGLVKKGYQVCPASSSNEVTCGGKDSISAIIALRIDSTEKDATELHTVVHQLLVDLKIVYYSLLVTVATDCCWHASGLQLPKALPPAPLPNVRKPSSDLN